MDGRQQGKVNYQRELDRILSGLSREEAACRACSACCALQQLCDVSLSLFSGHGLFYNHNIGPEARV